MSKQVPSDTKLFMKIMERLFFPKGRAALIFLLSLSLSLYLIVNGCSTLSENQLKSVEKFASGCDTFSRFPSLLYTGLSDLREERGLLYASTLTNPDLVIKELNSICKSSDRDKKLAGKMDISLGVLKKYASALKTLSSPARSSVYGTEIRSLGRALDSLLLFYNSFEWTKDLPSGILSFAGKVAGLGAELISGSTRSRMVKELVVQGDTLVVLLTENLKEEISEYSKVMLDNEKEMTEIVFLSYLSAQKRSADELGKYIDMQLKADKLSKMRSNILTGLNSLRRSHSGMTADLQKKRKFIDFYDDLNTFLADVEKLKRAAGGIRNSKE